MFNYNDVEDDIEDRRPVLEGGLTGTNDQKRPDDKSEKPDGQSSEHNSEPPTIIKKQERLAPTFPYSRRRKFYTKGTQLSVFEAYEQ